VSSGRDTRHGPVDGSVSLTTDNYRVDDRVNKVIKKSGYRNVLMLFFVNLSKNEREFSFSVRVSKQTHKKERLQDPLTFFNAFFR
jgi:hypothetical protein